MNPRSVSIILAVALCINTGGCQTAGPSDKPVCEYRTGSPATQCTVIEPGVFALWRWHPGPLFPHSECQTEVTEVFVDRANPIGFRRENDELIGVAGPATLPLEDGNYRWQRLKQEQPMSPAEVAEPPQQSLPAVIEGIGLVVLMAPVVVGYIALKSLYGMAGGKES